MESRLRDHSFPLWERFAVFAKKWTIAFRKHFPRLPHQRLSSREQVLEWVPHAIQMR